MSNKTRRSARAHRFFCMAWVAGFASAAFAIPMTAAAKHGGACSGTSKDARLACHHEVKDDFWIARGNCKNLSGSAERRECEQEAWAELRGAFEECGEQFAARQDLCDSLGQAPYDPQIDPDDFLDPSETAANPNPLFPLVPGNVWVYEGGGETITVTVTDRTKEVQGVECIVVQDVVEEDGELVEDTDDWYAQDVDGNVWYFGEIAKNYEDGEFVDIEGSWTAGVDSAKAGILMKAAPAVGDVYRQEFALGDAEDAADVVSTTASAIVPAAECDGDCVVTHDFTPIEPDANELKYYKPGVGMILEFKPDNGERVELVEFQP